MAQVVSSNVVSCPSCSVQAVVRVWTCGCQGISYPEHSQVCKQPRPYFDIFISHCQKQATHGDNPQTH